jgi:hypothetical protein
VSWWAAAWWSSALVVGVLPYLGGSQVKALQPLHLSDLYATLLTREQAAALLNAAEARPLMRHLIMLGGDRRTLQFNPSLPEVTAMTIGSSLVRVGE